MVDGRTDIKTNSRRHLAEGGLKWRLNLDTRLYALAFFEDWTALDVDVKEVDLLVPVGNLALLVDPDDGVLDALGRLAGLVYTDMDRQLFAAGFILESSDKLAFLHGLAQAEAFLGG